VTDDTACRRESERLRLAIELAPEKACLCTRESPGGIDPSSFHGGEIDHQSTVTDGGASNAVTAASHRNEKIVLARKPDCSLDVGGACAACNERRVPIDRTVPDSAGGVVRRVARTDQLSSELMRKCGEVSIVDAAGGTLRLLD
jgi:hypothetical protein